MDRAALAELDRLRARLQDGSLRGAELRARLEAEPEARRDRWVERLLEIDRLPALEPMPDRDLIAYQPSGVGAVLALIRDVPIGAGDTFVDIGSGLGKVTLMVQLLTGASAWGLELDAELVQLARERAAALGLADHVHYEHGDARERVLPGTVYFLYAPVTGGALEQVMARLETAKRGQRIVVCTLALDLARFGWLVERRSEDLFVSIYDRA